MDAVPASRLQANESRYHPRARHQEGARRSAAALAWRFFWTLRWWYLPMLLSDYGRMVLRRKYDAITTDRAYDAKPRGSLGFVGRAIDRKVLEMPLHEGLRQRLALVEGALVAEARAAGARHAGPVRVLSAPCGAGRDVAHASGTLRKEDPALHARLEMHGLDLDATGEALPLATARVAAAGGALRTHREDLFASRGLASLEGGFDVVNCIGLTAWLDEPDVERLARRFRGLAAPGAALVVDNFAWHSTSHLGKLLEINTRYHDPKEFVAMVERAGWRLERAVPSANGVCVVHTFRAI